MDTNSFNEKVEGSDTGLRDDKEEQSRQESNVNKNTDSFSEELKFDLIYGYNMSKGSILGLGERISLGYTNIFEKIKLKIKRF